jgi:hypothetical protein
MAPVILVGATKRPELGPGPIRPDKVQRVVVLATPVVRIAARGAKFTRLPWAMVASSSVSVGLAVRTGVREIQVLSSLVAHRIEQATEHPPTPGSSRRSLSISTSTRSGSSTSRTTGFRWCGSPASGWGAFGRSTSKRAGKALDAADKLDGRDLAARWQTQIDEPEVAE